ncbi:23S rRNA pseudouridine(1911/1915/1917) synthase [Ranunculus cassubicifolius]
MLSLSISAAPKSLLLLGKNPRKSLPRCSSSSRNSGNYAGVELEETVEKSSSKLRIDSWISSRIAGVSRARVQSSIRAGLVSVNNRIIDKVSHVIRTGDKINCRISELQPLSAEPEDIPLDIIYEDAHLLVLNKPPHMVVHPAPGNPNGTLVNGILHHCTLPTITTQYNNIPSQSEDDSDADDVITSVRPGIVHRLDKGTSGLLVVAKDEHSHAHLSEQFKEHTIHRVYASLTTGVPPTISGRVDVPIGRDINNRIRMAAIPNPSISRHVRHAASRYKVIEMIGGGGCALVQWRLETGRTHQIRAHAKYLGIPLLGDEVYGGTKSMAMSAIQPKIGSSRRADLALLVQKLDRPCLHALSLGFKHPHTGETMQFSCQPPSDFSEILSQLRSMGSNKYYNDTIM